MEKSKTQQQFDDALRQPSVKFGLGQIGNPTPKWAQWVFRIFFYVSQTIQLAIVIFTSLPADVKLQIVEYNTFANLAAHGLTKLFGIPDDTTEYYDKKQRI